MKTFVITMLLMLGLVSVSVASPLYLGVVGDYSWSNQHDVWDHNVLPLWTAGADWSFGTRRAQSFDLQFTQVFPRQWFGLDRRQSEASLRATFKHHF